ncbi:ABC transporter [Arthrobacter sp. MYb227]|uniref:ABC transporter permease n=1 Tax=Arthrobacter sp. MYb227 TaxID=1848601 RepID=UPI000CFBF955|nr:ABC transporter permease [Arthrobacter sp. MYb227]PQZ90309.1 ABC transporter [Arthrobacter sp. MYb227]
MSTAAMSRPRSATPGAAGGGNVTFFGVMRSEFIKFASLPSTLILILSTMAVMIGFAALGTWLFGSTMDSFSSPEMTAQMGDLNEITASMPVGGLTFAQLIIGSMAVMVMSSEFATGAARSTFVAVPRRQLVFWAKTLMVTVVSALVALISILVGFVVAKPIADNYSMDLEFTSAAFQRNLWFGMLYVVMVSLIGLSLGSLLRNSAGAIVVLAALFFVVSGAVAGFSTMVSWLADAMRFLPDHAATALMQAPGTEGALETWQSGLVVAGWIVIPLAVAALVLQRRDI